MYLQNVDTVLYLWLKLHSIVKFMVYLLFQLPHITYIYNFIEILTHSKNV